MFNVMVNYCSFIRMRLFCLNYQLDHNFYLPKARRFPWPLHQLCLVVSFLMFPSEEGSLDLQRTQEYQKL